MQLYFKIDFLFNKKILNNEGPQKLAILVKNESNCESCMGKYGEAGPIHWRGGGKGTCKKKSHGRVPSLNTCACRLYYVYYLFYKSQTYCRDDQG